MKYQLLLHAEQGGQPDPAERTAAPAEERTVDAAAGAAGLQWLWGMVELRLSQPEPDTAV